MRFHLSDFWILFALFSGIIPARVFSPGHVAFAQEAPVAPPLTPVEEPRAVSPSALPVKIRIESIVIEGSTLVELSEIEAAIESYLPYESEGANIREDLKIFEDAITALYQDRGYFMTKAYLPEQEIQDGVLKIVVLEGLLGDLKVIGNSIYKTPFVISHFNQQERKAIQNQSLERSMLLLNDYMDLQAKGYVQPGSASGKSDLGISVHDLRPLHFTFEYNNFGARLVSRHRFDLGVEIGNLLREGSDLSVHLLLGSPVSDLTYWIGRYRLPIGFNGTRVNFIYSGGDFDAGRFLSGAGQFKMDTQTFGVSVSHPFIKQSFLVVNGEVGFDVKDFDQFDGIGNKRDRIRGLRVAGDYNEQTLQGKNIVRVSLSGGLGDVLGGMDDNDLRSSRAGTGADNRFLKMGLTAARFHRLNKSIILLAKGDGQFATRSLVVGEQFSLGGVSSVRGYPMGEFLGDDGYNVTLEARMSPFDNKDIFHLAFFVDAGRANLKRPSAGESDDVSLSGVGLGARFASPYTIPFFKGEDDQKTLKTDLKIDVGFPLEDGPVTKGNFAYYYVQVAFRF
jgi:hemolysin activation/secretion protein